MEETKPFEKREDHHLISPTAKLVAHLRSDTDIPYSKMIDELCEAGKTTEELFGTKEVLSWMSAMLELRYKSLTELLHKEMIERGIKQVLELACGVQPRGIIESVDPEIKYMETDLPEIAKEKEFLVKELEPGVLERNNYSILPLNILDGAEFERVVDELGGGSVAIINEGLLPYLSVEEKRIAGTNVHAVLTKHGGVWITPDISNGGRMRKIIELFPGAEGVIRKISESTGRDMKANSIGDKETTMRFYEDLGFKIAEYSQLDLVQGLTSLDSITDTHTKEQVESVLNESGIWVLEVK